MIDRHAGEVPLIATVIYYAVLTVLLWPPSVLALWVLEDLADCVRLIVKKDEAT